MGAEEGTFACLPTASFPLSQLSTFNFQLLTFDRLSTACLHLYFLTSLLRPFGVSPHDPTLHFHRDANANRLNRHRADGTDPTPTPPNVDRPPAAARSPQLTPS